MCDSQKHLLQRKSAEKTKGVGKTKLEEKRGERKRGSCLKFRKTKILQIGVFVGLKARQA